MSTTRKSPVAWARVVVDVLVTLSAWVGGAGLVAGLLVLVTDVIGRAFGYPISGSSDIVQMCFVVIVFGAVPLCERTAGNVRLDLFEPWFSPALNRLFDGIATAIGLVIFALIGWKCWEAAQMSEILNLASNIRRIPKAPFQIGVSVACGIVAASMLVHLFEIAAGQTDADRTYKEPTT